MDSSSGANASASTQQSRPESLAKDLFLLIGELLGLAIAICFLLVILNYFRILKLDSAFPRLSFLPHLGQNTAISQKTKAKPTPAFVYNQTLAKTSLASYVRNSILPAFIPSNIDESYSDPKGGSRLAWTQNDKTKLSAEMYFVPNSNQVEKYAIRIQNYTALTSLDGSTAEKFVQTYFSQNEKRDWACSKLTADQTISCKASVNSAQEKQEFNVVSFINNQVQILNCSIPHDSPIFSDTNQCFQ